MYFVDSEKWYSTLLDKKRDQILTETLNYLLLNVAYVGELKNCDINGEVKFFKHAVMYFTIVDFTCKSKVGREG